VDVRIMDLGDLLGITDYFVLASATNDRQLRTIVDEVERQVKEATARGPRRREGTKETGWILLDYGDVVVHAFTQEQRRYYDLERLWSDAPLVDVGDLAVADAAGD
jgi:ribosome-associated protein